MGAILLRNGPWVGKFCAMPKKQDLQDDLLLHLNLDAERDPLQAKVNKKLFDAVSRAKPQGIPLRVIVEWGMRMYLAQYAPAALRSLAESEGVAAAEPDKGR